MLEIWKPITGYEDYYEVSSFGRVRAKDRLVTRSDGVVQRRKGHVLSPVMNKDGYLQCKLCRNGAYVTKRIHRLVAEAFLPNPLCLEDVNHKDADRANCRVDNLEWMTHEDNVRQSIEEGRHFCTRNLCGANNPNYHNDTLKRFYAANPDAAVRLLSRPGGQNGRSRKVALCDAEWRQIAVFPYIGACAEYLLKRDGDHSSVNALRDRISAAAKTGKPYRGSWFMFI